ncbi:hypothetical protein BBF96_12555 [Anoxybacter fermentans]|uniref:Bypass of forespore C C-terminal domain-containing protein n=1 Tax=Anoxybacter fermentans TaxID=1323375 RepID=A0A3Q9HRP8_9FIRM|nr:hypothetical protein [Anoxybacter fermentans]AZR74154.1 hypothetical protein BBF96_12555 [Anoxybacter fermentans]
MKLKIIPLFILILLISVTQTSSAEDQEYQIPDNFDQLVDITFKTIYRNIKVNENLFYDLYLFDENFMVLSAITRGQGFQLSLRQIKEYYKKSLDKYDLEKNFMLMVMAYDLNEKHDFSNLSSRIGIRNSKGKVIYGTELENYNSLFIISFPKEQVDQLLKDEKLIIIQFKEKNGQLYEVTYKRNYRDEIPVKIKELIEILKGE